MTATTPFMLYNTAQMQGLKVPSGVPIPPFQPINYSCPNSVFAGQTSTNSCSGAMNAVATISVFAAMAAAVGSIASVFKTQKTVQQATAGLQGSQNAQRGAQQAQSPAVNTEAQTAQSSISSLKQAEKDCKKTGNTDALRAQVNTDTIAQQGEANVIEQMTAKPQQDITDDTRLLSDLNASYTKENDILKTDKKTETDAIAKSDEADKNVDTAHTNFASAKSGYESAKNAYDSATPENKASLKPALDEAQKKWDAAQLALPKAIDAQTKAKGEKQTAIDNRQEQEKKVNKLIQDTKSTEADLNRAKQELAQAQRNQVNARKANQQWGQEIAAANTLAQNGSSSGSQPAGQSAQPQK